MSQEQQIQLFEDKKVRTVWDSEQKKWYFSIVDVIQVLTDSPNARKYWSVLKTRLKKEGCELTTICSQLKLHIAEKIESVTSCHAFGVQMVNESVTNCNALDI